MQINSSSYMYAQVHIHKKYPQEKEIPFIIREMDSEEYAEQIKEERYMNTRTGWQEAGNIAEHIVKSYAIGTMVGAGTFVATSWLSAPIAIVSASIGGMYSTVFHLVSEDEHHGLFKEQRIVRLRSKIKKIYDSTSIIGSMFDSRGRYLKLYAASDGFIEALKRLES